MTRSMLQKASVFLWLVLGVGMIVELAIGAWHGTWGLQPLLPAVLCGGIFQKVVSMSAPTYRRPVPVRTLVLVVILSTLAVISSVVAWSGGDVPERTSALVAGTAAVFFLGGLMSLEVRARGADRPPGPR